MVRMAASGRVRRLRRSLRVVRSGSTAAKEVKSWVPRTWCGGVVEDGEVEGEMAVPDVGGEHGGADRGQGVLGQRCEVGRAGKMRYS